MRHPFAMPKLYSYTRFSTPEQAEGDSERRQLEAAAKFAEVHGLRLDHSLRIADLGVSAYRGANLAPEAGLGQFLEKVRQGLVEPGSMLLLESLDRFSRMEPLKVQHELTGLLLAGMQVATLTDGKIYSRETLSQDGGIGLMVSLMVAIRAHEESATKGRRVAAAWAEKRRKAREGETRKLTGKAPAWLCWKGDGWAIDEIKAEVVRRVYSLTLAGEGEHKIAERFNGEGVRPLGRGKIWHRSSVAKLLRNRAVLGDLTPGYMEFHGGKKRRVTEEPITGFYPPVIAEPDWMAVRSLKDGHTAAVRGRGAALPLANVLAGLARCPVCSASMTRVSKGARRKAGAPKLVCTRAKAGAGCQYRSVPLETVEGAIFSSVENLLADVPAGDGGEELDSRVRNLSASIAAHIDHMEELDAALGRSPTAAGLRRMAKLEVELGTLEAALREAEEHRRMRDEGLVQDRTERLLALVEEARGSADSFNDRGPVNAALRVLFEKVTVDYRQGRLRFAWRQGGETDILYAWPAESEQ